MPLAVTNSSFDEGAWSQTLGFGVGTPGYMAPEQWRGDEIDTRADIFAVGVIAYELIVGHSPFRGATNHEVRDVTLRGEPSFDGPEWTSAPPTLKDTVRKALSRDPEQRFATAKSMLEALGPLSRPAHSSVSVRRTPTVRSLRDEGGRRESLAGRKEATTARHR